MGSSIWWLVVLMAAAVCGMATKQPATLNKTTVSTKGESAGEMCQPDKLTVYKVILHTFWSRDRFPKHYPDWRPPAQWSRLIGRSHDNTFQLFRLGKKATPGLQMFAETGKTDLLEEQSQGERGIYDEFTAPAMTSGVGRSEAEFFVDGNHSRVSLMTRIVPSPDWFIGIDSFNLCVDGNWLDSITIEVDPVDAGTDNGFTFTAPNWPTDPQGIIYRITSRYPSHSAGSFYYPYMKRLPTIGSFQFIKVKEYELSEVFHHSEDKDHFEVMKMEHISHNEIPDTYHNNDIEEEIEEERQEEELRKFDKWTTHDPTAGNVFPPTSSAPSGGDKDAILNSIVQLYNHDHSKKHYKNSKYKKAMRKMRPPRDCRVSEWGEWGACSKTCGIGEMQRRRQVQKHARRGGKVCPPLLETKWCGSARSCTKSYFKW